MASEIHGTAGAARDGAPQGDVHADGADRSPPATPTPDSTLLEVFDRLLLWFSPLAAVSVLLAIPVYGGAARRGWLLWWHLGLLLFATAVSLARKRVPARIRLALYGSAVTLAALAELLVWGLSGGGFVLALLTVLISSVAPSRTVRWCFRLLVGAGLAAAAVVSVFALPIAAPEPMAGGWAWASNLALFAFAGCVVLFWRHAGDSLHRANDELRVVEGHFRSMFEMAGDAVLVLENERIVEFNTQARVAFGFSAEELRGQSVVSLSAQLQPNGRSSAAEAERLLAEAVAAPLRFRWLYCRKDGRTFETEVSLSSSVHGSRRFHLALVRDLSDVRLVERENRLLATALNHAGEAVAITDADGRIVYVNNAFEENTGYRRHEVHGRNPRILKSGRHDEAFYRDLWSTLLAGRTWRGRLHNRRKDGGLFTENTCITPLRDERGRISHFVAVKRDISHELALEDQLVQSRKMEAVGRLAGGIAHDFNNILQVITGNVTLASMDAPAGHPVHGSLGEISRASERAVNLVQQLLAFSRREELRLRPVELGALVAETARMVRRLIGEDIALVIPPAPGPLPVLADPGRIEQVLINLCVNARDAMPDGGRLTVETEVVELDSEYCAEHADARPGRHVVVAVSDEGVGIPKEIQHRIFEPFFSTKEVGRGTGLGLATVYAIVRQHGGFIHLYSEVGLGTTFRFYLPAAESPEAGAGAEAPPELASLQGGGETILLAEDDEQVLDIAQRVLAQAGYRVLAARDGEAALAVHAAHAGRIDLAILDVVMPRCNGRVAHDELRRRDPELPVLFATGYSYHHLQDGLLEATEVIRKPFTPRELLGRVRTAIDGRAATRSG